MESSPVFMHCVALGHLDWESSVHALCCLVSSRLNVQCSCTVLPCVISIERSVFMHCVALGYLDWESSVHALCCLGLSRLGVQCSRTVLPCVISIEGPVLIHCVVVISSMFICMVLQMFK